MSSLPELARIGTQVLDRAVLDDTGAVDKHCVTSTGGPLRVTLAWADRPPAHAAGPQLVNDLDLEVKLLNLGIVDSSISGWRNSCYWQFCA